MIKVNGHTAGIKFVTNGKGNPTKVEGTFTSASIRYGIVDVNVGFKPDLVMVFMPLTTNPTVDTCSYWEKDASWAETSAIWCLTPAEGASYKVELGRVSGETGIQQINNDGFSYMSNGGNTQGCSCRYIAIKYAEVTPILPLIPVMTSNTMPSGVASASTEYNPSYYAYKAFDNNFSTLWGSHDGVSAGQWIKYDFGYGNEKNIDSFYFKNRAETNYAVGSFKFQGSNDDTNWTDLAEVTGVDVNDSATIPINEAYKNTAFRYVRWLIVSNAHGSSGTGFVELQVNGY